MVRLRKLAAATAAVVKACANMLLKAALAVARLAEHLEKYSASK